MPTKQQDTLSAANGVLTRAQVAKAGLHAGQEEPQTRLHRSIMSKVRWQAECCSMLSHLLCFPAEQSQKVTLGSDCCACRLMRDQRPGRQGVACLQMSLTTICGGNSPMHRGRCAVKAETAPGLWH